MTHEEQEEIQNEIGRTMLADDIALFKLRLAQLNQGMDEDTERLGNSIADIIGRLHGVHVTKEELGI